MVKLLQCNDSVEVPSGVTVTAKARHVKVTGPRGTLERVFKPFPCDIRVANETATVESWFSSRKQAAAITTITSHIRNMIIGVTKGFRYKMKSVYAHFPIALQVGQDGTWLEIKNFLGERMVRRITMLEGVKVMKIEEKDSIALEGNDITKVSLSAARVQQSTMVKNKDIRKFLDGVYVSHRGHIVQEF